MTTILTTFKIRRDTAANWTAENPVLAEGEPGLETDTRKIKWGDGSTAWNSLAYEYDAVSLPDGDYGDIVASGSGTVLTVDGATTVGRNLWSLANPSAVRFLRINADNSVTARTAAEMLADLGAVSTTLHTNVTPVNSTATTAEQDLMTYTLPAGTLAVDGQGLRIIAAGQYGATARSKQIDFYFGSNHSITFTASVSSANHWRIDVQIFRKGATTQVMTSLATVGIAGANENNVHRSRTFFPAQTLSGALTIKCTATVASGAAASDVIQDLMQIQLVPA